MIKKRLRMTTGQILAWADAHHKRKGEWPKAHSGPIPQARDQDWRKIDNALRLGFWGLGGGSSLAKLLDRRRGVLNPQNMPRLTAKLILSWADRYHRRTGKWPVSGSGPVDVGSTTGRRQTPNENWKAIDSALRTGKRGLKGGTSLARLLCSERGERGRLKRRPLTEKKILRWADQHYRNTRSWPRLSSGEIVGTDGEVWGLVDQALRQGQRGLPGGSSLPQLLHRHRKVRNQARQPRLSIQQILAWADVHYLNTDEWPDCHAGYVIGAPEDKWRNIDNALRYGLRGMRGGSSLAKLFAKERGRRNKNDLPRLTDSIILKLADAHRKRTGKWPTSNAGEVEGAAAPEETWSRLDQAMGTGLRGLPGGSSIAKLLAKHRNRRHKHRQPRVTDRKVLKWIKAHRRRTGEWPGPRSGPLFDVEGEKWRNIDNALRYGLRGHPGDTSLTKFIKQYRAGKRGHSTVSKK